MKSLSLQFYGFSSDEAAPSFPTVNAQVLREQLIGNGYDALLLRGLPIDPLEVFIEDDIDSLIMSYLILEHELTQLHSDRIRHTLSMDSGRIWIASDLDFSRDACAIHIELQRYGHSVGDKFDLSVSTTRYVNTWRCVVSQLINYVSSTS